MRLLTVLSFAVLVFVAIVLLVVVIVAWPPNMGLDFTGGVQLVYEVDRNALVTDDEAGGSPAVVDWPSLIRALTNRVNPAGMKEVVVRRYGEWQVEIVVPQADRRELAMIKKLISTAGTLEFRIVAKPNHAPHEYVINLAKQQAQDRNKRRAKNVRDGDDTIVGYWARVDREEGEDGKLGALRVQVAGDVIRNATTGELTAWNQIELDSVEIDVLMIVDEDPRFHVKGEHLGMVSRGYDETMRPCVRFNMRGQGAGLMGALTGSNLPDEARDTYQRMAILFDGQVLSAPRVISQIRDRGQITGSFTQEDVDFIVNVLHAGTLPVMLNETPVSETAIASDGTAHQTAGLVISIALGALVAIWLVLLLRYGLMGLGGSLASSLQVLIVLATIELVHAAVTMPLIFASAAILLLAVVGKLLICESVRRRSRDELSSVSSIWGGFLRSAIPFALALAALWFSGIVVYAMGTFAVRSIAGPVVLGSMAALVTSCFCLLLPMAVITTERQDQGRGDPLG